MIGQIALTGLALGFVGMTLIYMFGTTKTPDVIKIGSLLLVFAFLTTGFSGTILWALS